jgi:hypothetical protein
MKVLEFVIGLIVAALVAYAGYIIVVMPEKSDNVPSTEIGCLTVDTLSYVAVAGQDTFLIVEDCDGLILLANYDSTGRAYLPLWDSVRIIRRESEK